MNRWAGLEHSLKCRGVVGETQDIGEMRGDSDTKLRNLDVSFRLCGARASFSSDKGPHKRDTLDLSIGQWFGYKKKKWGMRQEPRPDAMWVGSGPHKGRGSP